MPCKRYDYILADAISTMQRAELVNFMIDELRVNLTLPWPFEKNIPQNKNTKQTNQNLKDWKENQKKNKIKIK